METEKKQYVYPVLGEELRCMLKELGVSQLELATAAGMSKSTLQKCLKGAMFVSVTSSACI